MRQIELLAPARDADSGMAAIDHGADAVYIGAQRFGARSAATNSTDDIAGLCRYAHRYGAKVYVALNTIVYDNELKEARHMIEQMAGAGVDALLVQDMAVAEMALEIGLPVHASTQTDNRTAAKVQWLHDMGFSRAVLARELNVAEISAIHGAVPDMQLEAFVHGALCVSYSGQCYASHHCFGRSANRGECAQLCRMKFDLVDSTGRIIVGGRHLLSLKDMNRMDHIEELLDAGVTSLKIEGRLRNTAYVKNVTAAYSRRLNEIICRRTDSYCRASLGRCSYTFEPEPDRTFNRGYTDYFVGTATRRHGGSIASPYTPKAIGRYIGKVSSVGRTHIVIDSTAPIANGDGLCFFDDTRELQGFRVNRAEGRMVCPHAMPHGLHVGTDIYRNHDHAFETMLSRKSADRRIPVSMTLTETATGYALTIERQAAAPLSVTVAIESSKQDAQTPQNTNILRQLTKLGTTVYECTDVSLPEGFNRFIPSGQLAEMRRKATEAMDRALTESLAADHAAADGCAPSLPHLRPCAHPLQADKYHSDYPYLYNVANSRARRIYTGDGPDKVGEAFELTKEHDAPLLMQCRHCLRLELGHCTKEPGQHINAAVPQWREPLYLVMGDGRRLRLAFDCRACQMNVFAE